MELHSGTEAEATENGQVRKSQEEQCRQRHRGGESPNARDNRVCTLFQLGTRAAQLRRSAGQI